MIREGVRMARRGNRKRGRVVAAEASEGVPDEGHPWRERRDAHPTDQRLRLRGFMIHARPRSGPALWRRDGNVYTEHQALWLAEVEEGT